MKVTRADNRVRIDLTGAEAVRFLDELLDVPGGSRMTKLRQVCKELGMALELSDEERKNEKKG